MVPEVFDSEVRVLGDLDLDLCFVHEWLCVCVCSAHFMFEKFKSETNTK